MPTLTEGRHTGGFLVWEAFRDYCREVVTIAAGTLEPGTVLGKITRRRQVRRARPGRHRRHARPPSRCSGTRSTPAPATRPPSRSSAAPPSSTATISSSPARRASPRSPPPMPRSRPRASSSAKEDAAHGHHGHLRGRRLLDHRAHPRAREHPLQAGDALGLGPLRRPRRALAHRGDREPRRHAVADPVLRARLGLRPAGARAPRRARLRLPPVQEAGRDLGLGDPGHPRLRLGERGAAGAGRGRPPAAAAAHRRRGHLRVPPAATASRGW